MKITCSHHDRSYDKIYWYRQTDGQNLQIIGYLTFKKPLEVDEKYKIYGDAEKEGFLELPGLGVEDTGFYYCATPPHLLRRTSEHKEARLDCFHGDNSYPYMLWYQQQDTSEQKTMELIGYLHYENPTMEKKFEPRFTLTGHSKANATLVISNIRLSDSAVYYCAAS
ncbi:hypothetical protein DPEC_G00312680 [Dallia pectoralis]|uniref:Uncharacterized protein n=1 Tax=Dallia pectoralis TaxID=75939 RepID=A0ACC2FBX1_DALPE|nr:hypothetical protein DPEC_G00312680 [Dallia pectoralis]